jgi:hypothetical protein
MISRRHAGLLAGAAILSSALAGLAPAARATGEGTPAMAEVPAPAHDGDACAALASLELDHVEISLATTEAAGAKVPSAGLTSMYGPAAVVARGLPAFCRIVGHVRPARGSDIGFEVWLPVGGWDGRLHGIGIGGFAGGIDYFTLGSAIRAGQAGVATDTGHSGTMMESAWAKGHPERVRDYGWRAVHLSTVAAKKLVAAYYGKGPDKSYFVGCSGGGRQGLMEAARFPEDYDGVLAGAPAASWTDLAIAMTNAVQAQRPPGAAIRRDQMRLLQDEVVRQCDDVDGQRDAMISEPGMCRFDAAKLACGTSSAPQCFSTAQVTALQRIYTGPRDGRGRQLASGFVPSGSEMGNPAPLLGWEGYMLPSATARSGGDLHASGLLDYFVQKPFATTASFDFDRDPARLKAALSADLDAPADLRRFFARGGKLIMWHGWADAAIPPGATLAYHDAVLRRSGARASAATRLFMVPAVQHCSGGTGPDAFGQAGAPKPDETPERNMVTALQAWVEGRRPAPENLVARRGHGMSSGKSPPDPERQRLLCAWPAKPVLRAGGDPDQAASYACS